MRILLSAECNAISKGARIEHVILIQRLCEVSGVTILRLLGQVESYLSILLLNQDVLIIFSRFKAKSRVGEISVLWCLIK